VVWSAFVWAADAHTRDSRTLRAYLLAATVLIFIVGLALLIAGALLLHGWHRALLWTVAAAID
jgi:hypothetical protein